MIPLTPFLMSYLGIYLLSVALDLIIDRVNVQHAQKYRHKVPQLFKGMVDEDEVEKINQYTLDKSNVALVQTIFMSFIFLLYILTGMMPWLAEVLSGTHFLLAGLIFFAVWGLVMTLPDLPFDYYRSFVIEERYGFNTKTVKVWLLDLVKSVLVGSIIGAILLGSVLLLIHYATHSWWFWAWAVFFLFQVLLTGLYSNLIAPLFNTFTPLADEALSSRIENLTQREGISLKGIYEMDATKRSKHTNAYFSGLGKTKRIVLFDSLIKSHEPDEIEAVLAHEMGHLKKNHVKKQLAIMGLSSLCLFYLASLMITWDLMFKAFGFSHTPMYAGLFLVGVLWEPFGFFLAPMGMFISRKFEQEADDYSLRILKTADPMVLALKKMAKDNLSNLRPHPLYVWFNYSHPPLIERIKRLRA